MASEIALTGWFAATPVSEAEEAADAALDVFHEVEAVCTRFDPSSPLMILNASPGRSSDAPDLLRRAVLEAHQAYVLTAGRFDPRVLGDLVRLGYDRTFVAGPGPASERPASPHPGAWTPCLEGSAITLGDAPIDLGGIGKGLALRWAAERLRGVAAGFIIDAGGDCVAAGRPLDGQEWLVSVEDPDARQLHPLMVLGVNDAAMATSGSAARQWRSAGRRVHHLIDPRTGEPAAGGLVSVTVVGDDPAWAEVWAKALFVGGSEAAAQLAAGHRLDAVWVDEAGEIHETAGFERFVRWRRHP
jgi:thiamine biosynthesis lipoprotein